MFAYHAEQYDWMPMPERNVFGYSFWLECLTASLLLIGSMTNLLTGVFRVLQQYNPIVSERVADDMMFGVATRYEDSGYIK